MFILKKINKNGLGGSAEKTEFVFHIQRGTFVLQADRICSDHSHGIC